MSNEGNPQIHNRNNAKKRRYTIDRQELCNIIKERKEKKYSSEQTCMLKNTIRAGCILLFVGEYQLKLSV
jgi:hypothetical protein